MGALTGDAGTTLRAVPGAPVIDARGVTVTVDGATILADVDLRLDAGEHLVVLGPNGGGKTTLLRVLATYRFPTRGRVELLGHRLGRVDVRALRPRIGLASIALDPLVDAVPALDLVAAAHRGAMAPRRPGEVDPAARTAAERALRRVGAGHLGAQRVDTLSQGERQRVRIARALATDPDLLLLDEPFAGLDLGGRETLLGDLDRLLATDDGPTVVLVTHHLEEVPVGSSRALLLAAGRAVAAGPVDEILTSAQVSAVFEVPIRVERDATGRYRASGTGHAPLDAAVRLT